MLRRPRIAHLERPPQRFPGSAFFFQTLVPAAGRKGAKTFSGTVLLRANEAKEHSDTIVANAHEVDDRNARPFGPTAARTRKWSRRAYGQSAAAEIEENLLKFDVDLVYRS